MPIEPAIEHYTYDDYVQWEGDWELIAGTPMTMSPSPVIKHQAIAVNILFELKSSIGNCDQCLVVSEQDWKVSEDTVLRPDVALICNEPNEDYITKAPEIIVEIISKRTAKRDEVFKYSIYEKEKVAYYIIIYPSELKAKLFMLANGQYTKMGDFSQESYTFENTTCSATIDFDRAFRQFRK